MHDKINNEIFTVLLKDVEQQPFGANLTNIISLKKGEVAMATTKKLVVIYDGEEYEPVNCQSVKIQFEGDTVILTVVLKEDKLQTEVTPNDAPAENTIISTSPDETFELQGDDLDAFEALSDFRNTKNQGKKEDDSQLETCTIESEIYDIQDLQSVQNAIFDLITREKEFLNKGYIVFKYVTPKFEYKDGNLFKLVESVVLIKQKTIVDVQIVSSRKGTPSQIDPEDVKIIAASVEAEIEAEETT